MFKRIILMLTAFVTLLGFSSCGGAPKKKGFSQFEITYYHGPQGSAVLNEEFWKAISECGFTTVPLEDNSLANNKKALEFMRKYGLTCFSLCDSRIKAAITLGTEGITKEEVEELVQKVIESYAEYDDIIKGWWLYDEPGSDKFEILSIVAEAFKKYDPEREVFIDLFPNYASAESQLIAEDYADYVNKYLEAVDPGYLCYDHYHFLKDRAPRKGFFSNFELIRSAALDKKIDYMSIILLTEHMGYANLTRSQIEWEVNMCLTYGAKRISYFTFYLIAAYMKEGWDNACMDYTGKKYPHYYDVQAINAQILPLGKELFNKTSEAVFHLESDPSALEEGSVAYTPYGKLGAVTGEGFVIGFFNDKSFMITNKKYEEGDVGKNILVFNDVANGLEYFDTDSASWKEYTEKDANGNYIFEADGGKGILFRVK
ncbi:MAG: hypothetical protein IJD95_05125 [Clostridia bacterium]|nr:hypothetical protein [Clostridia bacterium]